MTGATGRPTSGARLALERIEDAADAATYRGFMHFPDSDVPVEARVARPDGAVSVSLGEGGTAAMEKTIAALVRAATKALVASESELPRKIVRWRG